MSAFVLGVQFDSESERPRLCYRDRNETVVQLPDTRHPAIERMAEQQRIAGADSVPCGYPQSRVPSHLFSREAITDNEMNAIEMRSLALFRTADGNVLAFHARTDTRGSVDVLRLRRTPQ